VQNEQAQVPRSASLESDHQFEMPLVGEILPEPRRRPVSTDAAALSLPTAITEEPQTETPAPTSDPPPAADRSDAVERR
jgi:hypothetical protein